MKQLRQRAIRDLVEQRPIRTQQELAAALRERGLRLAGADPHAEATVDRAPLGEPVALVLGNEAHGLPAEIAADLDLAVRVPLAGRAESLNLAAAAAICLYTTQLAQR